VRSQYHETIFLTSASYQSTPCGYCLFIWVDRDVSLMRGLVQGWPKQIRSTWIRPHPRRPGLSQRPARISRSSTTHQIPTVVVGLNDVLLGAVSRPCSCPQRATLSLNSLDTAPSIEKIVGSGRSAFCLEVTHNFGTCSDGFPIPATGRSRGGFKEDEQRPEQQRVTTLTEQKWNRRKTRRP